MSARDVTPQWKQPSTKKPRRPMKRRSVKRAEQEAQYHVEAIAYVFDHPACELGTPVCTGRSLEVHHRRGRDGKWLLRRRYWAATCRSCHRYAESNREVAYVMGWLIRRNAS